MKEALDAFAREATPPDVAREQGGSAGRSQSELAAVAASPSA